MLRYFPRMSKNFDNYMDYSYLSISDRMIQLISKVISIDVSR